MKITIKKLNNYSKYVLQKYQKYWPNYLILDDRFGSFYSREKTTPITTQFPYVRMQVNMINPLTISRKKSWFCSQL